MDFYDIHKIIETASTGAIDISPTDRQEWALLCCALKVLDYDVKNFIAMSNTTAAECRKVWSGERNPSRYVPTEDKAKAKIVALAKAAGMNLNAYKIPTGVNRGNRGKTLKQICNFPIGHLDNYKNYINFAPVNQNPQQ